MIQSTRHTMQIEYVEPGSLNPAPYNPRRIDEAAAKRLAGLLDAHGFVDPIIARREDRLLIGGHQRLKANSLRDQPDTAVPCVFLDGVGDEQAKALNIALNSPGAQGQFHPDKLGELLAELDDTDLDVAALTAFRRDEIDELVRAADVGTIVDEVDIPETFELIVACESESHQRDLYNRLTGEGMQCRLLTL